MRDNLKFNLNQFHSSYVCNGYEYFGSFFTEKETLFRVYAPHATTVSVIGDFNFWNETANPMNKIDDRGIWETTIPNVKVYDNYKYCIYNQTTNTKSIKQDPYSYHNETNGPTSSKVYNLNNYTWNDSEWMNQRNSKNLYKGPMNIYEVHLGSWKKNKNNTNLSYRMIADKLIPYVKDMGYNYIELLPILEHPFLGSWGYQVTGYFSVTSRYGIPDDFMYFVDKAHQNDIGIILDWVPAHFPKDAFGLYEFDGECLYEDPRPTRKEFKTWGTRIFNYGKPEIKSFLISSADFYLEKYHIDGLRVDAVSSMLYLDYDRDEWVPNIYGGNYNLEAIGFLKDLNREMFTRHGNILMIAEESTAFPKITHPVCFDGLGFNYKWCMGWMNDTLKYIETDPIYRQYDHHKMTFTMSYIFNENHILPLSHDEVVHGKKSLLDKMPGDYDTKFANLRTYYMYMMTHPGKKLLFMGGEFGQFIEWDEKKELDWFLLKYERHNQLSKYVKKLNKLYLKNPNFYEYDQNWEGFEWIYANDNDHNTLVYIRKSSNEKKKDSLVILNFSGNPLINYEIHSNKLNGRYKAILDSDSLEFGGTGFFKNSYNNRELKAKNNVLRLDVPAMTGLILEKMY